MAKKQSLISRLILFSLLYPSCAWATTNSEVTTHEELSRRVIHARADAVADGLSAREELWRTVEAEVLQIVEEQIQVLVARVDSPQQHQQQHRRDTPSPAARAQHRPQITPPPSLSLFKRQDDGQIAQLSAQIQSISQASRSVSQASQQVSQSSQQLSNSVQQLQQQLSQTAQSLASARASADSARQSAEQANQNAAQASRDADQARQSADQAVASASSSLARSAASSASSAIAAMSASAQQVMSSAASLVQAAKADATAVRTEADSRVLQAQGAAVSVTQAALAIVGAIIGSSLLTIAAFVLVLRFKRRRRDRRSLAAARRSGGNIVYPGHRELSPGLGGSYEKVSYGATTVKNPEPVTQKVGFAKAIGANRASFRLATPPKGKFSLFPRNSEEAAGRRGDEEAGSPTSEYSLEVEKEKAQSSAAAAAARRSNMDSPPSLDKWLRNGTNVSPFGTLNAVARGQEKKAVGVGMGKNWPLDRKG